MIKCDVLKLSLAWNFHNKILRRTDYIVFRNEKQDSVIKTREFISFLPLISDSLITGLIVLLETISAIES